MDDRWKIKKKYRPPVPHLLQAQQALALLNAKVAGRPGTGSYPAPAPSPSPTTQLSRMKSCLWGWSCYHYSLAQRPISHSLHMFLATLSIICKCGILGIGWEWAWVSIPGERDLPKSLNWCSRLELRSHVQVRTHERTRTLLPWHSNKNKSRYTVTALTK